MLCCCRRLFTRSSYINPDFIAQQEFGDWNSSDAIIKAANCATGRRENALINKTSMAIETVFSTPEKVEFVQRAKVAGFFVRFFFVCTNDPSINAQRVALRVMEGGHDVPISKIISRYYRSITKCIEVMPWVDRAYFYDNSETDADPSLMFRVVNGKIAKIYEIWFLGQKILQIPSLFHSSLQSKIDLL